MLKKALASVVAAGLLTGQTVVAVAATDAATPNRSASPVADTEQFAGGSALLIALFAALAVGLIVLIEEGEDDVDDLPVSP